MPACTAAVPEELPERAVKMVLDIRAWDGKGHGELAPGPARGRQLSFAPARTSGAAIIIGRADPCNLRAGVASSIAALDGRILGREDGSCPGTPVALRNNRWSRPSREIRR